MVHNHKDLWHIITVRVDRWHLTRLRVLDQMWYIHLNNHLISTGRDFLLQRRMGHSHPRLVHHSRIICPAIMEGSTQDRNSIREISISQDQVFIRDLIQVCVLQGQASTLLIMGSHLCPLIRCLLRNATIMKYINCNSNFSIYILFLRLSKPKCRLMICKSGSGSCSNSNNNSSSKCQVHHKVILPCQDLWDRCRILQDMEHHHLCHFRRLEASPL